MARETGEARWIDIALAAESRMAETKGIIPNVDYFAAPVLYQIGFPLNLMTNVVASSRIAGWSAHILEQYANNRLIRPRALYKGHRGRKLSRWLARSRRACECRRCSCVGAPAGR